MERELAGFEESDARSYERFGKTGSNADLLQSKKEDSFAQRVNLTSAAESQFLAF
jgi:hypothetical protein